jgi:hypothetical protein
MLTTSTRITTPSAEMATNVTNLFASQFRYAAPYPVGATPGMIEVGATLPKGKSKSKKPTEEEKAPKPSPIRSPNVLPANAGAEVGVSSPNATPTPNFSQYFDRTPTSPRTVDPSTLGPGSGNAAPNPVPAPTPNAPAQAAAQPVDNNPLGGFGHWFAHTFDSARHGVASAANSAGGIFSQLNGMPNAYSPHISHSGGPSFLNVPNYVPNGSSSGLPRGLTANGGFPPRSAPVNPQQFIDIPGTNLPPVDVAPGVDLNAPTWDDYHISNYELDELPPPNAADRVPGIPSPSVGAIEAPKPNYSQYFTQPQREGAPVVNPNLSAGQFGRQAASDAGQSAGSDAGSWIGTFLRDLGEEEG